MDFHPRRACSNRSVLLISILLLASTGFLNWPHVALADQWGRLSGPRNHRLLGHDERINETSDEYDTLVKKRLESIIAKGPECFDLKFYRQVSPDEFKPLDNTGLWNHFIEYGFMEGRPHRLTC